MYRFFSSPLKFLVQHLYSLVLLLRGPAFSASSSKDRIRIVCLSDTHTFKPDAVPAGDILIHSGDLTNAGSFEEIQDQIDFLSALPHKHKLVIAGNHDSYFDPKSRRQEDVGKEIRWGDVHYLQHSSIKLSFPERGRPQLSFYGAPQIPACGGDDFAFQYQRGNDAWSNTIPINTDVLITHTPPKAHLDLPVGLGCEYLAQEVWNVRPKVHVFGHVHAGYGREYVFWDDSQRIYERLYARGDKGMLRDMIAVKAWMDVAFLVLYGALGILWSRVWGGDDSGGIMINTALMYRSTGRLGNSPQVVDI